jgi:hypothetical protein
VDAARLQRGDHGLVTGIDLAAGCQQRTVDVGDEQAIRQRETQAAG